MSGDSGGVKESSPVLFSAAFWVDTIKTLGVPVVVMGVFMWGGWNMGSHALELGEKFINRSMDQFDQQTIVIRSMNDGIVANGQRIEKLTEYNARMMELHEKSLKLQQDTMNALKDALKKSE